MLAGGVSCRATSTVAVGTSLLLSYQQESRSMPTETEHYVILLLTCT